MEQKEDFRLIVFGSGRGTNFQSIIDAIQSGDLTASVSVVVTNNPEANIISRAENVGIDTIVVDDSNKTRNEHERKILEKLEPYNYDLACLAGYMRILSPEFIQNIGAPIINIHPSLLPSFRGLHAQQQALEYGVKVSGCTVHKVNEEVDAGRILGQICVKVKDNDTEETLSQRILKEEHKLYPDIIQKIVKGEIILD